MGKKYFWLKLKDDFFRDKRIKKLRRIAGGDTYTIIYLKLQLLSLKNNGVLIYEGVEDTLENELALEIDEDVNNVKIALAFLFSNGLIEETENNYYLMTETIKCIGSESTSAERVRKYRELKANKLEALQCNTDVTNCNTEEKKEEKEIEKKKEKVLQKEIKKEKKKEEKKEDVEQQPLLVQNSSYLTILSYWDEDEKIDTPPYKEIIDYLNEKIKTHYLPTTPKTQTFIRARWREGFHLDDFKKVIDKKCNEWLKDSKMRRYLRPETLFGTKFESYLNEKPRGANLPNWYKEQNNNAQDVETETESLEDLEEFFKPKDN